MMVVAIGTGIVTQSIFSNAIVIRHLMNEPGFEKRLQGSVYRYPVVFAIHVPLNVTVRYRYIFLKKNPNNITSTLSQPKGMIL